MKTIISVLLTMVSLTSFANEGVDSNLRTQDNLQYVVVLSDDLTPIQLRGCAKAICSLGRKIPGQAKCTADIRLSTAVKNISVNLSTASADRVARMRKCVVSIQEEFVIDIAPMN